MIAPDGAAAYQVALHADLQARKTAAAALLDATQIMLSPTARQALAAGQVDSRLLIAITALAAIHPIDIVNFGNTATGASASIPLRFADLAQNDQASRIDSQAYVRSLLSLLDTEAPTLYHPARTQVLTLPGGMAVLRIEFAAPSPLGLLQSTNNRSP